MLLLHVIVPFAPTCRTCPTEFVESYVPIDKEAKELPPFAPYNSTPSGTEVTPFNLNVSELISIDASSTFIDSVFPVFPRPPPAVILPAPENCVNPKPVVPIVAEPVTLDNTYPPSALTVPSSTKQKTPPVISADESLSIALVNTKGLLPSPTVVTL